MWKKKQTLLQRILQNTLENQGFQKTEKFIEMKSIILGKVDEMCNILKSQLATGLYVKVTIPSHRFKSSDWSIL